MKRIALFVIYMLFCCVCASAQQHRTNYTTKMAGLHGKPHKVLTNTENMESTLSIYDEQGRIISEKISKYDFTLEYEWTDSQIIMKAISPDGETINSLDLNYIDEPNRFYLEMTKGESFDYSFNDDGELVELTTSSGGQSATLHVKCSEDGASAEFDMIIGGVKVMSYTSEAFDPDENGNFTREVSNVNGQQITTLLRITYYE